MAISTSTPAFSSAVCGFMSTPPKTTIERRFERLAYLATFSATCTASSRVGVSTSARTGCRAGEALAFSWFIMRCNSGSVKAAVLPVPVCAAPITSRPCSTIGMALAWIGVIDV